MAYDRFTPNAIPRAILRQGKLLRRPSEFEGRVRGWAFGFGLLLLAASARGQAASDFAGDKACAHCHEGIRREWAESRHSRTMRVASRASVKGDFAAGKIMLHGETYGVGSREDRFHIIEPDLTDKPREDAIQYTIGGERYQQYLTTLPDGRIVVLPPVWDILRKKWVSDLDIENPEEGINNPTPVWNKSCYQCHASGGEKNFDLQKLTYRSTWRSLGVDCESCHGPGGEHARKATAAQEKTATTRASIKATMVNPANLTAAKSTMICAQCHALRDRDAAGFKAGDNFYDYYAPVMEYRLPGGEAGAYWADGRPRQLSNEAIGLWQSGCYLKGMATCVSCHAEAHKPEAVSDAEFSTRVNARCLKCHTQIGEHITAHTHHGRRSAGSLCVECHMPATIVSLNARMRDHSMSIPTPENTVRYQIPNACNICHREKDAGWAARTMEVWYGKKGREKMIRRADAFSQARQGDAASIPGLLEILGDSSNGAFLRANAAGYLGGFSNDPAAYDALWKAFGDAEPVVRETAATSIRASAAQREELADRLVTLLGDPIRTVRMSAGIAMVAVGVRPFPGQAGELYEQAKKLYHERAELNTDDAQQQMAAGKFAFLSGDMAGAVAAFRATLKLDPSLPAQYYLGRSLAEEGEYASSRRVLDAIPRDDPQYGAAQRLLAEMAEKDNASQAPQTKGGPKEGTTEAQAKYLSGQVSYQNGLYGAALKDLEEALRLAPEAEWAKKAEAYRAISLERLGRTDEAEAAMKAILGQADEKQDVELQLAYVELLDETGRAGEALQVTDAVIATVPAAPKAYFWRAKLLLELARAEEAAKAGERAVQLLPDFPEAHNLLLKIYQTLGRNQEAAQQAEWLREYQRRMASH